ncbi:MAG: YfdX family protein [Myxococcales bacterium]|nr:YfdX family protein [Myxococcales bacterium]
MLSVLLVLTGALTLAGIVWARPSSPPSPRASAATVSGGPGRPSHQVMMPILALVTLGAVWMGMLNARRRFVLPALAPRSSTWSACSRAWWWRSSTPSVEHGVMLWSIGTLLAGVAQAGTQLPTLWRLGYRPRLRLRGAWHDPGLRRIARLMAPALLGLAAIQINIFVNTGFAGSLGDGAVAQLGYAFRLFFLPLGVFGVALATVTTTHVSEEAARGDREALAHRVADSASAGWMLTSASAVGLLVLAVPVTTLIYAHGETSAADAEAIALVLQAYVAGLVPYSLVKIFAPAFYSIDRPRVPLLASATAVAVNIVFNALTYERLRAPGIALGTGLGAFASVIVLRLAFAPHHRPAAGAQGAGRLAALLVANAIMGGVVWGSLVGSPADRGRGGAGGLAGAGAGAHAAGDHRPGLPGLRRRAAGHGLPGAELLWSMPLRLGPRCGAERSRRIPTSLHETGSRGRGPSCSAPAWPPRARTRWHPSIPGDRASHAQAWIRAPRRRGAPAGERHLVASVAATQEMRSSAASEGDTLAGSSACATALGPRAPCSGREGSHAHISTKTLLIALTLLGVPTVACSKNGNSDSRRPRSTKPDRRGRRRGRAGRGRRGHRDADQPTAVATLSEDAAKAMDAIARARAELQAHEKAPAAKTLGEARTVLDQIVAEHPSIDIAVTVWTNKRELDGPAATEAVETVPIFASLDRVETLVASPELVEARKTEREAASGKLSVEDKLSDLRLVDANLVYTEVDMPIASTYVHCLAAQRLVEEGKLDEADAMLQRAQASLEVVAVVEKAPEIQARQEIWDAEAAFARGDAALAKRLLQDATKTLESITSDPEADEQVHEIVAVLLAEIAPLRTTLTAGDEQHGATLERLKREIWGLAQRAAARTMLVARRADEDLALADALMYLEEAQSEGLYEGKEGAGGELVLAEDMLRQAGAKASASAKPVITDLENRVHQLIALDIAEHRDAEQIELRHEALKLDLRMLMFDLQLPT